MLWLLCGLVLAGLALLLAVGVPLLRRLRDNQVEVAALRIGTDDGLARLRVAREQITEWRRARGGTGGSGSGA